MRNPSLPYVVPFLLFLLLLGLDGKLGMPPQLEYPLRVAVLGAAIWFFSRHVLSFEVTSVLATIGIGALVFLIWIAPDMLMPGYRTHWLFQNAVTGSTPVPEGGYANLDRAALIFRFVRAVVIVPIVEELFWRGWLMRWLIKPDFVSVPLGAYNRQSFWITAILFALEHGAFWDVGLLAGVVYNWWMVRTKSLGDCILAHTVTNGILSAYVVFAGKWQYW